MVCAIVLIVASLVIYMGTKLALYIRDLMSKDQTYATF